MSDSPKAPLSQNELLALQQRHSAQFQKNMTLFQRHFPEIYRMYRDYKATELGLTLDQFGVLNLVNLKLNNRPVYEEDPKAFCRKQFEEFNQRPTFASLNLTTSPISNPKHLQARLTNAMIEQTRDCMAKNHYHTKAPIGLMLMTGVGLGYHLTHIVKHLDVRNLMIFDPHMDSLFSSLYAIDWEPIIQYFSQEGRMLQFYIACSAASGVRSMRVLKDIIGMHNMIYTFVYRHFQSAEEKAFIDMYCAENHLNFFGVGFFDDEQVGLAHTVHNLNNKTPMFLPNTHKAKALPVFIIGNGPSLDDHIEFLKANQHKAIVLSCGTAMASLAKVGIKPDFHIEMERNIHIKAWIERGTTSAQRDGVTLLCLNTVSPEVIALFSDACMAKKANDIGEALIDEASPKGKVAVLDFCNPTVTNLGMTIALHMGFKQLYLIGVDLGLRVDGSHHSKLSLYQDLENKTQKKGHSPLENTTDNYLIPANFGGQVSTNKVLDTSRQNIELVLRKVRETHSDIVCFNSNNGARIEGTQTMPLAQLQVADAVVDKRAVIAQIKAEHCIAPVWEPLDEAAFKQRYLKPLPALKGKLVMKNNLDSAQKILEELNRIFSVISELRESFPIAHALFRGSINGYFTILTQATIYQRNRKDLLDTFKRCRQLYMEFVREAFEFMEKKPLELDDTYDKIITQLDKK